jgi:hypothetical protein
MRFVTHRIPGADTTVRARSNSKSATEVTTKGTILGQNDRDLQAARRYCTNTQKVAKEYRESAGYYGAKRDDGATSRELKLPRISGQLRFLLAIQGKV